MKKAILTFFALAVLFLAGAKTSSAIPLIPIDPNIFKKWHDARCAKFKDKIEERRNNFEARKENHDNAYNNLKTRIDTLIDRLDSNGYDTAMLKADLKTLEGKIDKFNEDYAAFLEKAKTTKDKACDDNDARIKGNLAEIRTAIQTVKKDAADIRSYYKNEIRSDIRAIKNQKAQGD